MINRASFVKPIPKLHPKSEEYKIFWRAEKKSIIEGTWRDGYYCPPVLYFYLNFATIMIKSGKSAKSQSLSRPFNMDYVWELGYLWTEARGFSGFSGDTKYTCHKAVLEQLTDEELKDIYCTVRDVDNNLIIDEDLYNNIFKEDGTRKEYVLARDYIKRRHHSDLGYPLYGNDAKNLVYMTARGCLFKDTKVLMYDGTLKNSQDIIENDVLMGPDSDPRVVQWIYSGEEEMYEIQQSLGIPYTVNKNHLIHLVKKENSTRYKNYPKFLDMPVYELINKSKTFLNEYRGYKVEVEFEEKPVEIDPYFLGVWLGDGNSEKVCVTTMDKEIVDCLENTAKSFNQQLKKYPSSSKGKASSYCISNGNIGGVKSRILDTFRGLNLLNNKHVPEHYKINSTQIRLQLLAGLLDTDGYYGKGYFEITQKSERLIKDIKYIADTLGFRTSLRLIKKKCKSHNFEGDYFSLSISGNLSIIPTRIPRKKAKDSFQDKTINVIQKIIPKGVDTFYGFHVDKDNLVLLEDCTVIHNSGKSFWGANVAAHEMLTDGQKKYNPKTLIKEKAEILIGAHDAKYSSDLCTKIKLTLDNLPGAVEINGVYYPCPISKTLSGSWGPSKNVEHYYKKKIGGTWVWTGSRSVIKHRTYRDNPFAAQGGRNTVKIADEIGVWDNLIESHYADEYTQKIGNQKFGSTLYQGTGGDLTGGGSISAQKMFFDPDAYDCLTFNDEWEKKGNIGLFIPATYSKIEYKDKDGNTNFELANLSEEKEREKKKKAKDPGALDEYIVYNPIKPSEIFLQSSQNIFPVQEMARTLARLEHAARTEWIGDLIQREDGTIDWKHNADLRPIYDFPLTKRENEEGCVVIYNPPFESADGTVPHGRYIAGMDPYDHDKAEFSTSLGSTLIYDRLTGNIVAEYTGRPLTSNLYYENARKLIKHYNAMCLYENEKVGFFQYLDRKNETWMLLDTPRILKDIIQNTNVKRAGNKGMHMVTKLKDFGINMINNWLREPVHEDNPDYLNAHNIKSIPLLKELILFNKEINADRVSAMIILMYHLEEIKRYQFSEDSTNYKTIANSDFFTKKIFARNPIIQSWK